jgi:hypothetical protein
MECAEARRKKCKTIQKPLISAAPDKFNVDSLSGGMCHSTRYQNDIQATKIVFEIVLDIVRS